MTTLLIPARWKTSILGVLATTLLLAAGGCKPSPPADTSQATPPDARPSPSQPTAADFQTFFQSLFPTGLKVEVKTDPPVRVTDAPPGSNVWLVSAKITLTPTEDLLALPTAEHTQPLDALANEVNALIAWRNAYAASPYAAACGTFEIAVPTSPAPQLIVVVEPKGQPIPPLYGKVVAEWQVDHWSFTNDSLTLPKIGQPRAFFHGPTMVKGSPEETKVLNGLRDAIAQARKDIETVRARYTEQVAKGTRTGALYTGTVSYGASVAPCELRFTDPPPGDARFVAFEVRLTSEVQPCLYTYRAKVNTELPLPAPSSQPAGEKPLPDHNLFQNLIRTSGKTRQGTLPNWLTNNDHGGQELLLLDGHIKGTISDFGALPGIQLSVQRQP